jgi:hypothetical protein
VNHHFSIRTWRLGAFAGGKSESAELQVQTLRALPNFCE